MIGEWGTFKVCFALVWRDNVEMVVLKDNLCGLWTRIYQFSPLTLPTLPKLPTNCLSPFLRMLDNILNFNEIKDKHSGASYKYQTILSTTVAVVPMFFQPCFVDINLGLDGNCLNSISPPKKHPNVYCFNSY